MIELEASNVHEPDAIDWRNNGCKDEDDDGDHSDDEEEIDFRNKNEEDTPPDGHVAFDIEDQAKPYIRKFDIQKSENSNNTQKTGVDESFKDEEDRLEGIQENFKKQMNSLLPKENAYKDFVPSITTGRGDADYLNIFIGIVETEKLKHTLAHRHFEAKFFIFNFLPQTSFLLLTSILSVLSRVHVVRVDENRRELSEMTKGRPTAEDTLEMVTRFAMAASIIGFVATAFNAFNVLQTYLDYNGRAAMHKAAALNLKNLAFQLAKLADNPSKTSTDIAANMGLIENSFDSIQSSCSSMIPTDIEDAFNALHNRVKSKYMLDNKVKAAYGDERSFYLQASNEVSAVISSFIGFPLFLLNPVESVNQAWRNIEKAISEQTFNATRYTQITTFHYGLFGFFVVLFVVFFILFILSQLNKI